jgi:hypothetical protein
MPKFMLLVRATPDAESGNPPTTEMIQAMMKYNTSLSDSGILHAGEGLLASSKSARINFTTSNDSSVTHGPFPVESLISGFWIISAKDLQEAIDCARKAPFRREGSAIEVRQIASAEDFGDQLTDDLKKQDEELRKKSQQNAAKGQ